MSARKKPAPVVAAGPAPAATNPLLVVAIRSRWNPDRILYSGQHASICEAAQAAIAGGADLGGANLSHIKADLIAEILRLPNELEALRDALIAGRVDGSTYSGTCACLAGTMAAARGIEGYDGGAIKVGKVVFHANALSPRERWFMGIRPGDTPDKSQMAAVALDWVNEAIAIRDNIRASVEVVL